MLIDFDLQNEGEWFYFFDSHIDHKTGEVIYGEPDTKARVKIRPLAKFIEQRMLHRKKQVEHVVNPKTRQMERIEYYPELTPKQIKQEREDTNDWVIQDFEGFKDMKTGKPIKCNRENKNKMMEVPVFDRFVARCLEIQSNTGIDKGEIETKNL